MTKNQKIALGCGGAGCLGLVVVLAAGVALYFMFPSGSGFYNYNVSTNRNANTDSDSNVNANSNSSSNSNANSNSSTSSMSDDDRHKLYQAASMTGDIELLRRVQVKLGLMDEDFTPGDEYLTFVKDHIGWAMRNTDFIQSIGTKEKALAYVNEHFPE
jgi:hypothetical protein